MAADYTIYNNLYNYMSSILSQIQSVSDGYSQQVSGGRVFLTFFAVPPLIWACPRVWIQFLRKRQIPIMCLSHC